MSEPFSVLDQITVTTWSDSKAPKELAPITGFDLYMVQQYLADESHIVRGYD